MKIGVDVTCWQNNRGFGRFTRETLTALFRLDSRHNYYLFTDQPLLELDSNSNVEVIQVDTSRPTTEAAVADSNRSPIDMLRMYRAVSRHALDVFFFPAVYSWYPVPRRLPTMVTVMDAIAEHYPQLIFPGWRSRLLWTIKIKAAIWMSERILTISNAAKEEIVEYIGAHGGTIDVTSCAPNSEFRVIRDKRLIEAARRRAKLPVDAPFIVFVGGLAPHKNLHGLLDGFELALSNGRAGDLHCALVGDFTGAGFFSNYESLYDRVQRSPVLRERVHFSGYLPDEDLVALYSGALAAAMPSYSEGFGLPAVEAMACGAPLLSSDRGSLPEVVGEAGIYFDPFDVVAISDAIAQMAEDAVLREQLASAALSRAATFTWERAARLTLEHLEAMHEREKA